MMIGKNVYEWVRKVMYLFGQISQNEPVILIA